MRKVIVTDWETGFQKVEFTKLLRYELGYSLSEAKSHTDSILDRKPVQLALPDGQFDSVVVTMSKLGAVFHEEGDK